MKAMEAYWSCIYIEQQLHLANGGLTFCCDKRPPAVVSPSKDSKKMVKEFLELREEVIYLNQGKDAPCKGCPMFKKENWSKEVYKVQVVNWGIQSYCQFSCIYCCLSRDMKEYKNKKEPYDALEVLEEMESRGIFSPDTYIEYGSGEIAVHPRSNEYLEFLKRGNYRTSFATNAGIFNESIAKMLGNEKENAIVTSLDCGTEKTFRLIHGVNRFHEVVENLKKYRKYTNLIYLKYIFLEENSNLEDIDGFIKICKEIGVSEILISADCAKTYDFTKITEINYNLITSVLHLIQGAIKNRIHFSMMSYIGKENIRILVGKLLEFPEIKHEIERINLLLKSSRIFLYGAGKNCKNILNKWSLLGLKKPDLIWDIAASGLDDIRYGYSIVSPEFETLNLEQDAVFITLGDDDVNNQLVDRMKFYGFERVVMQYELTLFLDMMIMINEY